MPSGKYFVHNLCAKPFRLEAEREFAAKRNITFFTRYIYTVSIEMHSLSGVCVCVINMYENLF